MEQVPLGAMLRHMEETVVIQEQLAWLLQEKDVLPDQPNGLL